MWKQIIARPQSTLAPVSLSLQHKPLAPTTISRLTKVFPKIEQVNHDNLYGKPFKNAYYISRTHKGNIPVYRTYKSQAVVTEVRRIDGSLTRFRDDVQKLFPEKPKSDFTCLMSSMTLRIKGDVSKPLKKYLSEAF
ncbi:hypothetical protein KL947_003868 [Ogataea haglerorum]|nr:hypothetical protein KL947_003868 [Ogataea haglerorum]